MTEPDDFGLPPAATIAHVAAPALPQSFGPFWQHWQQHVMAGPRL